MTVRVHLAPGASQVRNRQRRGPGDSRHGAAPADPRRRTGDQTRCSRRDRLSHSAGRCRALTCCTATASIITTSRTRRIRRGITRPTARIAAAARQARAITVPSDWVAEPFRRDMQLRPRDQPRDRPGRLDAGRASRLCAVEQRSRRRRVRPRPGLRAGRARRAGGGDVCARGRAGAAEPDDRGRAARTRPCGSSGMPKCTWRPPARRLGSRTLGRWLTGVPVLGYAYGGNGRTGGAPGERVSGAARRR